MGWTFLNGKQFDSIADDWQSLNKRYFNSLLLDSRFVSSALEELGDGREVIAIFRDETSIVAIGVFSRPWRFTWQTFQPANAPMGAWICDPGRPVGDILRSLTRALPGFAILVALSQVDPQFMPRPESSGYVEVFDYIETAWIEHASSFENYWKTRGKNIQHNMRRQQNRLKRQHFRTRLELVQDCSRIEECVQDYADLEEKGWKGRSGTAVGKNDRQGRFYKRMLEAFSKDDEALICRYFFDESLAASDICLIGNGVMIVLKTAYDESIMGFSPAQLMRFEVLRWAFGTGKAQVIEFYGPARDWHRKLTDKTRTMYHVNFFRWPLMARLRKWL